MWKSSHPLHDDEVVEPMSVDMQVKFRFTLEESQQISFIKILRLIWTIKKMQSKVMRKFYLAKLKICLPMIQT
jgi:hypothetical protein